MIFHKMSAQVSAIGAQQLAKPNNKGPVQLDILYPRVLVASGFCLLLVVAALVAYSIGFPEGAQSLIHLVEVLVGAMVGAIFGERAGATGSAG